MRSAAVKSLVIITTLFIIGWSSANAEIFKGFPDMLICKPGHGSQTPGELVFYVEGRDKKGTAYYKNIGRQGLSLKISQDGKVTAETASVNDCLNMTLQQLRKQGRTFDFARH